MSRLQIHQTISEVYVWFGKRFPSVIDASRLHEACANLPDHLGCMRGSAITSPQSSQ